MGKRKLVSKNSLRIQAVGAVDEVNSYLGIISSQNPELKQIKEVQKNLFNVAAIIAGAPLIFPRTRINRLEKKIDELEKSLPALKNFVFPGGTATSANLFYARALVRKAERVIVRLDKKEGLKPEILAYLNRLSDYLFILAREINYQQEVKEEIWKSSKK